MSTTAEARWWVGIDQKSVGPWTRTELAHALRSGQIGQQTLVCPVGGSAWVAITQVSELAPLFAAPPPPAPSPAAAKPAYPMAAPAPARPQAPVPPYTPVNPYSAPQGIEINTHATVTTWPMMATIVGNYFLYAAPIYLVLTNIHAFRTGFGEHPDSLMYWPAMLIAIIDVPVSLILVGLSITAGLKWQAKNRSALGFTYASIILKFTFGVLVILMLLLYLPILANAADTGPETPTTPLEIFWLILAIGFFAWEIAVFIWLLVCGKKLPWLSRSEGSQQ